MNKKLKSKKNSPKLSLLSFHLTDDILKELIDKKDSSGYTFSNLIVSGVKNPESQIGVYAGSANSYQTFAPLLSKIIKSYHNLNNLKLFKSDWSALKPCTALDEKSKSLILSTRIRVARNVKNYDFSP